MRRDGQLWWTVSAAATVGRPVTVAEYATAAIVDMAEYRIVPLTDRQLAFCAMRAEDAERHETTRYGSEAGRPRMSTRSWRTIARIRIANMLRHGDGSGKFAVY